MNMTSHVESRIFVHPTLIVHHDIQVKIPCKHKPEHIRYVNDGCPLILCITPCDIQHHEHEKDNKNSEAENRRLHIEKTEAPHQIKHKLNNEQQYKHPRIHGVRIPYKPGRYAH